MSQTILPTSLVTLNYRIAQAGGQPLISTFESTPATLQLGNGELSPALEQCLIGLVDGDKHVFELAEGEAFGPRNELLVERIQRSELPAEVELEPMAMLSFTAPDGHSISGLVRELDSETVLIDFNHPLAGKPIRFEVEIVGVL